ncbi:hypothetical protein N9547_00895 [bacterium]|nr:hypothetical protein [bacterium]
MLQLNWRCAVFYLQIFLPAGLVLLLFSFGHTLVEADYSGVYFEELVEAENVQASSEAELDSEDVPGDGNPVLADKYNYLKIENVFQGRLNDTKELFSFEVAIATYQTNVTADFFIKAIYEIEAELVSEISTIVVDTISNELLTPEGRKIMTNRIMDGLNEYLVEKDFNPDIHYVYIINYNIV